jgi:hypothetical protein
MNRIGRCGIFSLKGCQIVAGGRSLAKTTGHQTEMIPHPERVPEEAGTPPGCGPTAHGFPVVFATLRPPATV